MKKIICFLLIYILLFTAILISAKSQNEDIVSENLNINNIEESKVYTIEDHALAILSSMTLEEKVYQLFIVRPEDVTGTMTSYSYTKEDNSFNTYPVGGVCLFSSNISDKESLITYISRMQSASKIKMFIAVDEEGGDVARVADSDLGTTKFDDMYYVGLTGDYNEAFDVGYTIGKDIKEFGFNLDFAPVSDVFSNPNNTVIGTRSFGTDPITVARMVSSCVKGFKASGIMCTLKHFPGHGDVDTDTHEGASVATKDIDSMRACEFLPFIEGIKEGCDFIMTAHISAPNITGDYTPSSLSYEIVSNILRDELGFDGIILTDSMEMGAIIYNYDTGDAAVKALKAGNDMILMPYDLTEAANAILNAIDSGEIPISDIDDKVRRILITKLENGIIE